MPFRDGQIRARSAGNPTGLLVLVSTLPASLTASWAAPSTDGGASIMNYQVYYGSDPSNLAAYLDTGSSAPSRTINGLTPGRTYDIGLFAQIARGFSVWSGAGSVGVCIGRRIWNGTSEQPLVTAKIWNDTNEVNIVTAVIGDGEVEIGMA